LGESFLKISFLKVIGFLRIIFGRIKAGFHWDKYLSTGLEFKKKKLTDIGFLLVFPGLKEQSIFNGFG
jgi:hypothetical protein